MATTFYMSSWDTTNGRYDGRYLTVSCSCSGNPSTNKSTISWTLSSTGGSSSYYTIGATTLKINGVTVYSKGETSYKTHEFPAATGSKSGTTEVEHNTDGTKTITVSLTTSVYYSTTYTTSKSWTLDTIPRKPVVTQIISNIKETEFTINWNADKSCNRVWYSIDDGSTWSDAIDLSSAAQSGTITVVNDGKSTPTALVPNTQYSVQFCAHNKDVPLDNGAGNGYSEKVSITTYNIPYVLTTPDFNISDDSVSIELYNPLNRVVSINTTYTDANGQSAILYTSPQGFNATSFNISLNDRRNDLYLSIPNSIQGNYITNITYNNESGIKTGHYKVTSESAPNVGNITCIDSMNYSFINYSINSSNAPVFVQSKSLFVPTVSNITAVNGATMNNGSVSVSIAGVNYNLTYVNGSYTYSNGITINSRSNVTAVFTIKDSRGISTVINKNITIIPYDKPTVTYTAQRLQNYYDTTYITPYATVSPMVSGQVDYSKSGGNVPTINLSATSLPDHGTIKRQFNLLNREPNLEVLDRNYAWEIALTVTDSFGEAVTSIVTLSRGIPLIFIDTDKNSVGIEKFPAHTSSLEIDGDIYATNINTGGNLEVGMDTFYYGDVQHNDAGVGVFYSSDDNKLQDALLNEITPQDIGVPSFPLSIPDGGTGAGTVAGALSNLGFGWHYTTTDDDTGNMELRTTNCSEGSVRCWYNDVFAIFSINVKSANSWTNGTYYTVAILAQQFIDLIGHTYMDAFTGIISNGYPCQVLLNTWETGDRLQVKPINTSPASGTWYVATFVVPITR